MESDSENNPILRNLDEIPASLLSLLAANRKISSVFEARPNLEAELRSFHPFRSAALVAGLLTQPALQANTLRIELLIHLLVAFSVGSRKPSRREITRWLNFELGSTVFTLIEDPPEDVFLSNVAKSEGNFRVFEGLWESSDFYLQRVVNVVETLPEKEDCRQLKREVLAILKLSEEIAARRGLARFSPGNGYDKQEIDLPTLQHMKSLRRAITFSPADLERLQIRPADLEPFIFPPYLRMQLGAHPLGDTELEWRPIIHDNAKWSILLPTAISIAVRQHVFSWMVDHGYQDSFNRFYLAEYRQFLASTPILGSSIPRDMTVPSKQVGNSMLLEILREFDAGRYLQVIAIVSGLGSFSKYRFLSEEDVSELNEQIQKSVTSARSELRKEEGFKQWLTLLVWCGYGQPGTCGVPEETPDWRIEAVSAPDLEILGSTSNASPLFLWKLIDHERFLAHHHVLISNANGLLNLYGWWRRTNYKMLDEEMEFGGGRSLNLMIPTDCLAEVRKKVRQGWDVHSLPLPDGKMVRVIRKNFDSYFPEDAGKPNYGCIDAAVAGKLFGAFVGERLVWWVAADPDESTLSRDLVFQVWDAVSNWLERAVPLFEREAPTLVAKAVLIVLDLSQIHQMHGEQISEDILRSCLSVTVNSEAKTVQIGFRDPFFAGFGLTKNTAERTIVRAVAEGVLRMAGRVADEQLLEVIVREIVPNDDARHVHFFQGAYFRDHIREYDHPKSLLIDDADIARSKLGLGWLVRNPAEGDHFATAEESVRF